MTENTHKKETFKYKSGLWQNKILHTIKAQRISEDNKKGTGKYKIYVYFLTI